MLGPFPRTRAITQISLFIFLREGLTYSVALAGLDLRVLRAMIDSVFKNTLKGS